MNPYKSGLVESFTKRIQNRYYRDQVIHLDGYAFENCRFNNCKIITQTGAFALKQCAFVNNCKIEYGPLAVRIIKLWNIFNLNLNWPSFNPVRDLDGSVTIE